MASNFYPQLGISQIMTEMNDSALSSASTVYHGVVNTAISELRERRRACQKLMKDYCHGFDQVLGVGPEITEDARVELDEDRRTLFHSISEYWMRANQLYDADGEEGRAALDATLKAIEKFRRDYNRTQFFDVNFRKLEMNKLPAFRIPTKEDNGMIYQHADPQPPTAHVAMEVDLPPPSGSKRGRNQSSPGSTIVQQKKKGPGGPRTSSPLPGSIVVPETPIGNYENATRPKTNKNKNNNPNNNNNNRDDGNNAGRDENSADSGFLMPPPQNNLRRVRTANWVDGQSVTSVA